MNRLLTTTLFLAALPGPALAQALFVPTPSDTPRVSTQGMAEVLVPAARATAVFVLQAEGADVADAAAATADLTNAAMRALEKLGVDGSCCALVSLGAGPAVGPFQNRGSGLPAPPPVQEGRAALRVVIDPVDRLDEIVAAVLGAGAESLMSVSFEPDERPEVRREAARKAMAQARADAEVLAAAEGMQLGRALQISSTPDYVRQALAGTMIRTSASQGVPVLPSDLTVRVTLQVVWELVPR